MRDDDVTLPMIGAQSQFPFQTDGRVEFGFEGGFSFGWKSDREAIEISDGTFLITSDNDMRIGDVYKFETEEVESRGVKRERE